MLIVEQYFEKVQSKQGYGLRTLLRQATGGKIYETQHSWTLESCRRHCILSSLKLLLLFGFSPSVCYLADPCRTCGAAS